MSLTQQQPGDILEFTAPAGGVVSGIGVLIGALFVVPVVSSAEGARFNGATEGVYELPKTSAQAWTEGMRVYWDDTNHRCDSSSAAGQLIGTATASAANPSSTGSVKLLASAPPLPGESSPTPDPMNNIGTPGAAGFGVGVCPAPPAGFTALADVDNPEADTYGNYQYSDGSVMCWIPAFYYKWGTGANGVALNGVDIQPLSAYATVEAAADAGYAMHRAFYDNGALQFGVFVDKYLCSNNSGTASSILLGNPLSTQTDSNPISALTGTPPDTYGGVITAAKTRGARFFCNTRFIFAALALLSYAHAQARSSTTNCAWWDASANFPKGNNNNLADINDPTCTFTLGAYENQSKTGSASTFAKSTHNGQNSGVADLNGNMWEITPGVTSDGTNLYVLKPAARMRDCTDGNTLPTDLWGATGIAALYDDLGTSFGAAAGGPQTLVYGSGSQVLSDAASGNDWNWAGFGAPLLGGTDGTAPFGGDKFVVYMNDEMCPLSGGSWSYGASAGVWALNLSTVRGGSDSGVGFRAASYL